MYLTSGSPKFIKQTLLIGPDTIIVGNLNAPLSSIHRILKEKN
jgi:hypothetical protein